MDEEPKAQSLVHKCLSPWQPGSRKPRQYPARHCAKTASRCRYLPCHLQLPLAPSHCPVPSRPVWVCGGLPSARCRCQQPLLPHLGNRLPSLPGPLCRHQTLHVANGGDFLLSGGTWKVLSCLWVFFFSSFCIFPPSLTQQAVSMPLDTALGLPLFSACVHLLLVILHGAECQEMT